MSPRSLAGWLALGTALLALPAPARACTCAQPAVPREGLERADRVFLGKVERFEVKGGKRLATFRVATVWKGPLEARVAVATGGGDADCGVHFVAGLDYLVYASRGTAAAIETSICTRTAPRKGAREDLEALGPGTPVPGASRR